VPAKKSRETGFLHTAKVRFAFLIANAGTPFFFFFVLYQSFFFSQNLHA
jgi:hypothetical protein